MKKRKKKILRNILIISTLIILIVILLFLFKSCQKDKTLTDTDGDSFTDIEEIKAGTDINDPLDYPEATLIPLSEETIIPYNSQEDCLSECLDLGYDTGGCGFNFGSPVIILGSCTISGTLCESRIGCLCTCKNIANPLDAFTCGDFDDCSGTCPDDYPKCMNKHYDTYDACVCFNPEIGISPDWNVGGYKHNPK